MINPQPVYGSRSPYGKSEPSGSTPPPATPPNWPPTTPPEKPKRKRWKKVLSTLFIALLIGGVAYGVTTYYSLKNSIIVTDSATKDSAILNYSANNSSIDPSKFTTLGDGRFNMVFVGIDKAAGLTDSIQVISIDTINKESTITSIPRDLYVTVPGYGRTKINAAYNIGESQKAGSGSAVLKGVIGNILGTTITNYALIDFSGLEDLVNSLGGIDVNVPKAIYDPYFPADTGNGYAPFSISAGQHHMDGHTALDYARSRKTTSDFDRSARQQLIIEAIRTKALTAGVVTNPITINNILQSLGKSFRTDMQLDQIKTLINVYDSIPNTNKKDFTLDTTTQLGLLTSSSDTAAGYISYPVLGIDHNTDIQAWFRKNNPDPLLAKEAPTLTIANGGKATAKQMADFDTLMTSFGYNVTIDSSYTPGTKAATSSVYATNSGNKPITQNYLGTQFNTTVQKGSPLGSNSDFELIYAPSATISTPLGTVSPVIEPTN